MNSASSIFLCHSSEDKAFARKLGKRLSSVNVRVWIDEAEIKVGDSLLDKISQGIIDTEYLGIILSKNSIKSEWVNKEVQIATTIELKQKKVKVLPIKIDECDIPIFLSEKRYADFRDMDQFDSSVEEILQVLLPYDIRDRLCDVVKNAAKAEFNSYLALPEIKLEELTQYFTESGSALARITHLLKRHKDRHWVISNAANPSTCDVLSVNFEWIKGKKAEVTSREYWYLRWFDSSSKKYEYVLNEEINPVYILKLQPDGQWRVDVHRYSTSTCYVE